METLPLYPKPPLAAVEQEQPRLLDKECKRCRLHNGVRSVCMAADGEPGGVLIVGQGPGRAEDDYGRTNVGEAGKLLRVLVSRFYSGPVAYDNAVRCYASGQPQPGEISACRGYLNQTIRDVRPKRVIALGGAAIQSLMGYKLAPFDVRRGYGWLSSILPEPVPVFYVLNPAGVRGNKFVRAWLESDLEWALTAQPPFKPAWGGTAKVITTFEDAEAAEADLMGAPWFAHDAETAGVMYREFQVLCCGMARPGSDAVWVWDNTIPPDGELELIRAVQKRLLDSPKARKVGSNYKFDQQASYLDLGADPALHSDVRLKRKLLDPDVDADLSTMAELVGMGGHKSEVEAALVDAIKGVKQIMRDNASGQLGLFDQPIRTKEDAAAQSTERALLGMFHGDLSPAVVKSIRPDDEARSFAFGLLPRDLRNRYVARDALATARLEQVLDARLQEEPDLQRTWVDGVRPAAEAVKQVERWGIAASRDAIGAFKTYLASRKTEVHARIVALAGAHFDPDSPQQVAKLLFDDLKLPAGRLTPTGRRAADDPELERLIGPRDATGRPIKPAHPILVDIQEWRSLTKLDSNYATGMERHIKPDGRIHPHVLLDGARSGRQSCTDPNLYNIPRDGDSIEGKMARDCFTATDEKHVLISLDYKQLEICIAAMLSGDDAMISMLAAGGDFHQRTAEAIAPALWKIRPEDVQKKHRTAAKTLNFSILYGKGDEGVAAALGCTVAEAAKVRELILGKFHKLANWIEKQLYYAKKHGHCWTWWGGKHCRRRPLWQIAEKDNGPRGNAERSSWNTPIQGTGAEFCLRSETAMVEWLLAENFPGKLVLSVYDSLMLDVRADCAEEAAYTGHKIMTGWNSMGVPLRVDVEAGPAWGSLEKASWALAA